MPDKNFQVRIRMYRPGLGDCFLLTFNDGAAEKHILIDCGIFVGTANEKQRMQDIARQIQEATHGNLDALVATHEHWDHVAGFHYARDIFDDQDNISIKEVWLAWTEDPDQQIVQERRKLKMQLERHLAMAVQRLTGFDSIEEQECGRAIADVLAFNGQLPNLMGAAAFSHRSDGAMQHVLNLRLKRGVRDFLHPGQHFIPEWLPGVRVYVLGPPKEMNYLGELEGAPKTEQYFSDREEKIAAAHDWQSGMKKAALKAQSREKFTSVAELAELSRRGKAKLAEAELTDISSRIALYKAQRLAAELEEAEKQETFNRVHRWTETELRHEKEFASAIASYRSEDWRRIDSAWYNDAARLAMQLDSATNNTSLVLAFEIIATGQVLLFVGDAQIGNWQSWDNLTWNLPEHPEEKRKVTAKDLLARTVFYKVGHHGSINATRKQGGLELMTSPQPGCRHSNRRQLQ